MASAFDIGDTVKLTFYVRVDGVLTDATLVTLVVTKPDGTAVSPAPTVAHPSLGTYTAVVAPDQAGQWLWKYTATGPAGVAMTVEDGFFNVEVAASSTYYATVGELRDRMRDPNDKLDAGLLEASVRVASRAIDEWCRRRFWRNTSVSARVYSIFDPWEPTFTYVDDIATQTGLIVKTDAAGAGTYSTTWASSDYALLPWNADRDGGAYSWNELIALNGKEFPVPLTTNPRPSIQVTATWGWSQIPEQVREACLLKATNYYKRKDAPWGIAGSNEWGLVRITRQDVDVIELLNNFRKRSR